jgi:hypothetical protein
MMTDDRSEAGLEALHALAERIGLSRSRFQNKPRLPHYDLTAARRALAVQSGAVEVSSKELVRRCGR